MSVAVYLCKCGNNISERIDEDYLAELLAGVPAIKYLEVVELLCADHAKDSLVEHIREGGADRVVFAACSPRDHNITFMRIMRESGLNPFMMQIANIREHAAWVTEDKREASEKAAAYIRAAVARVELSEPLEEKEVQAATDVLIIGAGPAGLKAAASLAEAGRKVTLVERGPAVGGMPVLFEEIYPNFECGPCMLEPLMDEVLNGEHSDRIGLLTLSDVAEVTGTYGNFTVRVKKRARYVDMALCIGCGECVGPCPVQATNTFNMGLDVTKAVTLPFPGALPAAPWIDTARCLRFSGEACTLCQEACPVQGAIKYDDADVEVEVPVGAILVAIGADLYDPREIPNLGHGRVLGVYTSMEFERILSSNGPTGGHIRIPGGPAPKTVCIVHCAGSFDERHKGYCSAICCQAAFKFNHMIEKQLPGTRIYHFYKEMVIPGKDEHLPYIKARNNPNATFIRYDDIDDIVISPAGENQNALVRYVDASGVDGQFSTDMAILCMAMVPPDSSVPLSGVLGVPLDGEGFFSELHSRMDAARSKVRGIFIAGTCRAPMNIQHAMEQGMASAGYILSGLVEGQRLEVKPTVAVVDQERCGACSVCMHICPYKAIRTDPVTGRAYVDEVLCLGCGTCVAACPAGAIKANHYTSEQIMAEVRELIK